MGRARKTVILQKNQTSEIDCILPLSQMFDHNKTSGFVNEERHQDEEVESILPEQFDPSSEDSFQCPIKAIYGSQFGGSESNNLMKYSKELVDTPLP